MTSRKPARKPARKPLPKSAQRLRRPAPRSTPQPRPRSRPGLLGSLRLRTKLRLLAGVLLLGAALWAWQSGFVVRQYEAAVAGFYDASADAGLRLANVHVIGRERTQPQEILEAVALKQGEPILDFDPHAARGRLEALPWVREATVERRLPDLIYVTLSERRAMALWQLDGKLSVVDQEGQVIPVARPEDFAGLPLIVGPGAAEAAEGLFVLLATEPELARQVTAAVRVGGRRWNLRMEPGIDVRLPEEGAVEAWQMLGRLDREQGLLSRDLVVIDLRQPDRLLVRPSPGVEVEPTPPLVPGEDT